MNAQVVQCIASLDRDGEVLEHVDILDAHVVAVRHEHLPVFRSRVVHRRRHHGEIASAPVGSDVEQPFAMVQVIAVALFTRQKYGEFVRRPVGAQVARFRGILGLALQKQILQVAGLADLDIVEFDWIVVDLFELRGAQHVPP